MLELRERLGSVEEVNWLELEGVELFKSKPAPGLKSVVGLKPDGLKSAVGLKSDGLKSVVGLKSDALKSVVGLKSEGLKSVVDLKSDGLKSGVGLKSVDGLEPLSCAAAGDSDRRSRLKLVKTACVHLSYALLPPLA